MPISLVGVRKSMYPNRKSIVYYRKSIVCYSTLLVCDRKSLIYDRKSIVYYSKSIVCDSKIIIHFSISLNNNTTRMFVRGKWLLFIDNGYDSEVRIKERNSIVLYSISFSLNSYI